MSTPTVTLKNIDFDKFISSGNLVDVAEGAANSQKIYFIKDFDVHLDKIDIPTLVSKIVGNFDTTYPTILYFPKLTAMKEISNESVTYLKVENSYYVSISFKSATHRNIFIIGKGSIKGNPNSNDWIIGSDGDDHLSGDAGDDRLYGNGGKDVIVGDNGNDLLDGGLGNDRLYGKKGDDELYGDDGDDRLYGDEGDDQLNGGHGDDFLSGDVGDDTLFGGSGNDELHGNSGDDWLDGGKGDDIYVFDQELELKWDYDTILDNKGYNKILFHTWGSAISSPIPSPLSYIIKKEAEDLVISRKETDSVCIKNFFLGKNAEKFSFYNSNNQKYSLDPQNDGTYRFSLASK